LHGLALALCRVDWTATLTLKIERISQNGGTRFFLSGELRSADIDAIRAEIDKVSPKLALDLTEISVVDADGLRWLKSCQALGVKVENCAPYIREWMLQEES
jgi:hypothetical protein